MTRNAGNSTWSLSQAIQDDLQKKTSQILSSQSDESLAQINALQKEYEENHTLYAQKILRKITEV